MNKEAMGWFVSVFWFLITWQNIKPLKDCSTHLFSHVNTWFSIALQFVFHEVVLMILTSIWILSQMSVSVWGTFNRWASCLLYWWRIESRDWASTCWEKTHRSTRTVDKHNRYLVNLYTLPSAGHRTLLRSGLVLLNWRKGLNLQLATWLVTD